MRNPELWNFQHTQKLHFYAQPSALGDRISCRVPDSLQTYHHEIQKLCLCLGPMVCYRGPARILPENQTM